MPAAQREGSPAGRIASALRGRENPSFSHKPVFLILFLGLRIRPGCDTRAAYFPAVAATAAAAAAAARHFFHRLRGKALF
jgi:hypothetical protein